MNLKLENFLEWGDRLTKERLEQYRDICKEIEEIKADIAKRELLVTDTVIGSAPDYPYTTHPISVQGLADYHSRRIFVTQMLKDQITKLEAERTEIEHFLNDIQDSELRRIYRMRYVKGLTWQQVAFRIGKHDEQYPRKKAEKFLESTKSTKSMC